jgi:hypothetical protein
MSNKFLSGINVTGTTTLNTVVNAGTDTDKFLVLDASGNIDFRTGTELLSDIGVYTSYVPYTGATANVNLGVYSLSAYDLIINHTSGSGVAASITKGGNGEALTVVKSSGSGNAASITGGITLLSELNLTTDLADDYIASAATWNAKIGGTGTTNYLPKFTGSTSIGNSNVQDSGTLITLGVNSYVNGALGIGITPATGYNLYVNKNITGQTTSYGIVQTGTVLSDVTSAVYGNINQINTQAASFTLTSYYHYGTSQGTIGAGSNITTQVGYFASSSLTGATSNYGFQGSIASGTGRWNLYMDGTANNYMNGSLGIGSTTLTGFNLRVNRPLFGSTTAYSIQNEGIAQSDVTANVYMFNSVAGTAAASFTLVNLNHYRASQFTIGAGSSITNQYGFVVDSSLVGATSNYGFFGNIPSGSGRWNLYMGGTANNYMAGSLGIGNTSLTGYSLRVSKNITGSILSYGVISDGIVQSDVTSTAYGYRSNIGTVASSFILDDLVHYAVNQGTIGAGSAINNNIGFLVNATLTGGTNNYGFKGSIPSGTNRWNIYMDGTADNYINGALGIGQTSLTGYVIRVNKAITGGTTAYGMQIGSNINSDVTTTAHGFRTILNTQAAVFTLGLIQHYTASQGTFGAGSSVTNQTGFKVEDTLIGAINNYGFRGLIPSGTNRWNIYMDGTAANYLAGDTGIGTFTLGTATKFTLGGTKTASSAIARGQLINTTLVASANNDVLVGLDIQPTFTNGAFTGVTNTALRANGNITVVAQNGRYVGFDNFTGGMTVDFRFGDTSNRLQNTYGSTMNLVSYHGVQVSNNSGGGAVGAALKIIGNASTRPILELSNATTVTGTVFNNGNFLLQNGGTFTDAGFRLDVNGLTRFIGTATSDTAQLGSELAAVTGTGTNWTLAGTNLNVGGYTHTAGSTANLTTTLTINSGTYYQVSWVVTGRTAGAFNINIGGFIIGNLSSNGNSGPLASSTAVLTITPTTDFNGTVVLSIKTIGTSAASSTFASSALVVATEIRASDIASNLFFGRNAGRRNTTGSGNTYVGSQSGINITTGTSNTFLGSATGQNTTISNDNTFIGNAVGSNNTIGGFNTFVGSVAGNLNTTGNNNTFLGRSAGQNNTTGFSNVFVGNDSGRFITGGSTANATSNQSVFIGQNTRAAADNQTNQIVIGTGTTGLGSNTTVIGNSSTTLTALYGDLLLGTTTPSTSTILTVSGTETASSAIARGGLINTTLVASANNDVLVGLDIQNTFTNGAFTGVTNLPLRVRNSANTSNVFSIDNVGNMALTGSIGVPNIYGNGNLNLSSGSGNLLLSTGFLANTGLVMFNATRNLLIQNGGTFTDAGFRLDVNGTARLNGNTTINGSLSTTSTILQNGAELAIQDGTILYHTLKWFTPSSTVSSSGTTVTSVGTQFNSGMVGAKLTISGESRIITAYTSTTQVTVASAYSQNYSGIAAGSWGVFSKALQVGGSLPDYQPFIFYSSTGGAGLTTIYGFLNNVNVAFGYSALLSSGDIRLTSTNNLKWTSNGPNDPFDLGIRRNNSSTLEIYDGVTNDGALANRRDLLVRNVTSSTEIIGGTSISASAVLQADSTTKGFLPPRMTSAQRTAISSPATGLIVYQTDGVEGLWVNTSTGWRELTVV